MRARSLTDTEARAAAWIGGIPTEGKSRGEIDAAIEGWPPREETIMNWKHWLSVVGAAFAGGAGTWAAMHLASADFSTSKGVEGFLVGAVIAGAGAVAHLLQPAPAAAAPVKP